MTAFINDGQPLGQDSVSHNPPYGEWKQNQQSTPTINQEELASQLMREITNIVYIMLENNSVETTETEFITSVNRIIGMFMEKGLEDPKLLELALPCNGYGAWYIVMLHRAATQNKDMLLHIVGEILNSNNEIGLKSEYKLDIIPGPEQFKSISETYGVEITKLYEIFKVALPDNFNATETNNFLDTINQTLASAKTTGTINTANDTKELLNHTMETMKDIDNAMLKSNCSDDESGWVKDTAYVIGGVIVGGLVIYGAFTLFNYLLGNNDSDITIVD